MSQDKYTDSQLFNLISGNRITGESAYDIWKSLGNTGGGGRILRIFKRYYWIRRKN